MNRREFLYGVNGGLGALAFHSMLQAEQAKGPLISKVAHFPKVKAKRCIFLYMAGGPSHIDTFDPKPKLKELHLQKFKRSSKFLSAMGSGDRYYVQSPFKFNKAGQSGTELCEHWQHLAGVADELCVYRGCQAESINHPTANYHMNTGNRFGGDPAIGSWVTYGLGSENQNLPGFMALISSGVQPNGGKNSFGSGFLPSVFQGVQCRSKGDPVLYVSNPKGMSRDQRRKSLDALNDLNRLQAAELGSPETLTRIAQYEMAFRMQASVPEVMDISKEPKHILEAYGAKPGASSLANNILLARRLVEKGVRFVHLFDWGWDFHGTGAATGLGDGLRNKCKTMDKPVAALIRDLKQRGLLDETLIVWGGEFGRTPFREGRTAKSKVLGRDHYPDVYTQWMAGGGVKGGITHGASDELGFKVAEDKVHVHDLQATILHQLGFDHERLFYRFQGRKYRLTDVHGKVVKGVLT